MQIGIIKETAAGETRVAATPETVKKMAAIPGISCRHRVGRGKRLELA
jgi:NAD/NADP transhydrogenase alpha subunit